MDLINDRKGYYLLIMDINPLDEYCYKFLETEHKIIHEIFDKIKSFFIYDSIKFFYKINIYSFRIVFLTKTFPSNKILNKIYSYNFYSSKVKLYLYNIRINDPINFINKKAAFLKDEFYLKQAFIEYTIFMKDSKNNWTELGYNEFD